MNTEHLRYLANKKLLIVWYIKEDEAKHLFASRADAARYCVDMFGAKSPDKTIYSQHVETYFG